MRIRNISPHSPPVSFAASPPCTGGPSSEAVTLTAQLNCQLTSRQKAILLAGGLLAYTRENH